MPDGTSDGGDDAMADSGGSNDAAPDVTPFDAGKSQPWAMNLNGGGLFAVAVNPAHTEVAIGGTKGPDLTQTLFVERLDALGSPLWKKELSTAKSYPTHRVTGVAYDKNGALFAVGYTDDSLDFGGGSVTAGAFIVKYDAMGQFLWQRAALGPTYNVWPYCVVTKSNGNVVMTGSMAGTVDFGGGALTSAGNNDALIAEYTGTGQFVRSVRYGDAGQQFLAACGVDPSDNLYVGGQFESSIDLGGGALIGPAQGSSAYNVFVAAFGPGGNHIASKDLQTGSNNTGIYGLAVDASGYVYVTGSDDSTINLGGGAMLSAGGRDIFLGKLGPTLQHQWSKRFGDVNDQSGRGLAVTWNGIALTGDYQGNVNLGCGGVPAAVVGHPGLVVATFDPSGNCLASVGLGSGANNNAGGQAIAAMAPDVVAVGTMWGSLTIANTTLTGPNYQDGFAARFSP